MSTPATPAIENSTLYIASTTAWASYFLSAAPNPGHPSNPNEPVPSPGIAPSPERQSPEIPPDFTPPAPPEEPRTPMPGPDPTPGPGVPDVNPHGPVRVV